MEYVPRIVEVRYWQPYKTCPHKNVLTPPLWPPHSKKLAPPLVKGKKHRRPPKRYDTFQSVCSN